MGWGENSMVTSILKDIRGVVFDLDGTIVDSKLDFAAMRNDLGVAPTEGILEEVEKVECETRKADFMRLIREHELKGLAESKLMKGFETYYKYLQSIKLPIGILTRNSLEVTKLTLEKFELRFDTIYTRDDCAPKPSPEGLIKILDEWKMEPKDIVYIGDSHYDIQTALNAKVKSILFKSHYNSDFDGRADFEISCFSQLVP